jgi:spermidine synthase
VLQDSGEADKRGWYQEAITKDLWFGSRIKRVIYEGQSRYQRVQVLETGSFGRCLVLDGKTQSAEADEFVYHEALVHPVMVGHPRPETVGIAGGGEGATAREVLRHSSVKRVTMVDLDQEVVDICRQHLPEHHQGAFADPRLRLLFDDARGFLERSSDRFDVLVLDLPDPMEGGPAYQLYTLGFYQMLRSRLNPGGCLVTQSGPAGVLNHQEVFTAIHQTLKQVFPVVAAYTVFMQSFGEPWGFTIASLGTNPLACSPQEVDACLESRGVQGLRFYDGITHQSLFALPKFLREAQAAETRIITDEHPLFVF